jgi:hypothetical protein
LAGNRGGGDGESNLCARDIIDLWLNSRLFHSGEPCRGRFSRDDFDRELTRIGQAQFEFLFNSAIYEVALQATTLFELTEYTIHETANIGSGSDSLLDAISIPGVEQFSDGSSIRRHSPGITHSPRTPGEKLALLRRETRFRSLSDALSYLTPDNERLAHLILGGHDFLSILRVFGLRLASRFPNFSKTADANTDCADDDENNASDYGNSLGIARAGDQFWTNNLELLNTELVDARKEIMTRQNWIPKAQRLWKRALSSKGLSIPFPYSPTMSGFISDPAPTTRDKS